MRDEVVPTLLRVADHHQLLADVSAAVHRDEKLPHIFLHRLDLLREEHSRLWRQGKESGQRETKVMICGTIGKNPPGHRGLTLAFVLTQLVFFGGGGFISVY